MNPTASAITGAGLWIGACELLRNELLFKEYWIDTFSGLGPVFPSEPDNDTLWAAWSITPAGFSPYSVRAPGARDGEL